MKRFQNTKTALGHERECCEGLKREQISNHNTIFHIIHIFRVFHFSQYLFFTVARFLCLFHSSTRKRREENFNLIPSYLFSEHSPLHTQNTTLSSFGGKIIFRFATFLTSPFISRSTLTRNFNLFTRAALDRLLASNHRQQLKNMKIILVLRYTQKHWD